MTPLLMSVFHLSPALAIGTDLWFAAITKSGGSWAHHRLGHVDYRVTRLLLTGSVPATLATVALMHATGITKTWASALTTALGLGLLLTALWWPTAGAGARWACAWNSGCPNAARPG
jgi:uncharacterized membrane protein YfcA